MLPALIYLFISLIAPTNLLVGHINCHVKRRVKPVAVAAAVAGGVASVARVLHSLQMHWKFVKYLAGISNEHELAVKKL